MSRPDHFPGGMIERIGAALVAPRRALVAACRGPAAGKTGSDAAVLIALSIAASYTREVVAALWLVFADSVTAGLGVLLGVLSRGAAMDLAFLLVAGLLLTIVAGRRRAPGRDMDLGFVAYVPIAFMRLTAELLAAVTGMPLTGAVQQAVAIAAYGWAAVVLVLAWQTIRTRPGPDTGADTGADRDENAPAAPGDEAGAGLPAGHATRVRARMAGFLLLVLAGALATAHGITVARHLDAVRPVTPGDPAPAFHVHAIDDRGQVSDDHARLDELHGQVLLLDFWATWCGPCLDSMPGLDALHRRYRDQGLAVVSINMDDPAKARAVARRMGLDLPLYADDGDASHSYKVSTIPHIVLIDRDGMIRRVSRGWIDKSSLAADIERLLAAPGP